MKVHTKSALQLANAALSAAKSGVSLNIHSCDAIIEYIFSIFVISLGLIPVAGSLVASVAALLGQVILRPSSNSNAIWDNLRQNVENLIGAKVQVHQIKVLQSKIEGFESNMEAFTSVWNDYESADASMKVQQAETLRTHHIAFLSVVRAAIPEFQIEDYAVASLPLFAQAANIHLTLLADGIRQGLEWGFAEDYVRNTLQQEFNKLTASGKQVRTLNERHARAAWVELARLRDAILVGEASGYRVELLDTWRSAYTVLSKPTVLEKRSFLDYPSYAKQYYEKGRGQVQPYTDSKHYYGTGMVEALNLNALSDYDSTMIKTVLTYAEF